MLKLYKIFTATVLLVLLFPSCNLDKYPNDRISLEEAWQTVDDAKNFRVGIYSYFQGIYGGIYTYTSDYQSDLFNATISYSNRGGDMHRWDFNSSQYDIEDIWQYNYYTINNCNNIINNIDRIKETDPVLSTIRGEAYLMRAICYHTLVIRFAPDYEPGSAATALGLPLMLVNDPNAKPARSTLQETYARIKSDITEARKYLKTPGAPNSEYFTVDVINALEARVDLYMHNWDNAIKLSRDLINAYPLIEDKGEFGNMWLHDDGSEVIYRNFMSVSERSGSMSPYISYSTAVQAFTPDFVPSKWVRDLYEDNDIRKDNFFRKDVIICNSTKAEDVYMLNKFPGNPDLKKTPYEYYQKWKVFRSAEAYLIAAEASFRKGDEGGALGYLNDLRVKRSAGKLSGLSGTALLNQIKNEWIREFVGEGNRLDNLKRWGDGFTRHDPQNPSIVMSGSGFTTFSVEAGNQRFTWEIPANDLKANSNLVPNWK